jgi:HEPN domain-containing protein
MTQPEDEIRRLVSEWVSKADLDLLTVDRLCAEDPFRDIVAFHAQQATEKYLMALLTLHQIEFPKTHELRRLLELLAGVEPRLVASLAEIKWLEPFGVDVRYPGDRPDTLPGDEERARDLAQMPRHAVMGVLSPHLAVD